VKLEHVIPGVLAVSLVVAACSGSGDDSTTTAGSGSGATTTTSIPGGGGTDDGTATNRAILTIGDLTYDLTVPDDLGPCSMNGPYLIGSFAVDASGAAVQAGDTGAAVQINFGIPPADWEAQGIAAGSVGVEDRTEGVYWLATEELSDDTISVGIEDITVDGTRASGTASYLETVDFFGGGDAVVEAGTFDITCGG
jgi:hypothetical protein